MQLPFWTLLIPYIALLIVFSFWLGLNVYHLVRFGLFDFTGKVTLLIFSGLSLITLGFAVLLLSETTWTDTFSLIDIPSALIPGLDDQGQNNIQ
jgi:hypothetical protein